jgi:PadR family transcriptional regulator, regulatory protein PadR
MKPNEFARNRAAGTYDLLVLDVLRGGPNYGYGIVKRILEQSKHALHWREGTLYPVLHHLEEQGWVASRWQGPRTGRRRRYYRLTARGQRRWREQCAQWRSFHRAVNALLGL